MAATNFTPIILYHTTTASATPSAGNLNNGELAINITDGKLFYKDNGGTVQVIATKGTGTIGGSNTQVQYNSSGALAGSANFTFNGTTATINTLNLTNALGTTFGGTGLNAYTTGDLVYASGTNTLAKLGIGLNTYILTSTGSVPQWSAPSAVTVATANNLAGGAAGSVPYQSGASTTTFLSIGTQNQVLTSSGTAPQWSSGLTLTTLATTGNTTLGDAAADNLTVNATITSNLIFTDNTYDIGASGATRPRSLFLGTNLTVGSLTATRVPYAGTGGLLVDSANMTFNGTTLNVAGFNNTGNTTLGDAAGDTLTINGTAVSTPNGLNFDSGTLFIDAANNRVGVGTATPSYLFQTNQGGTTGVVVGAALVASGNGGAGRGVGLVISAPGSNSTVEVARIDGLQESASATANNASLVLNVANTSGTLTERARFGPSEAVFNEGGLDYDFRVESDLNPNMLFVDGGNDAVGVGIVPLTTFGNRIGLEIGGNTVANLSLQSAIAETLYNFYIDGSGVSRYATDGPAAFISFNNAESNGWSFQAITSGTAGNTVGTFQDLLRLGLNGVVFNEGSADIDFRVESNDYTHMLFVDAGNNRVGVNTASPSATLEAYNAFVYSNTTSLRAYLGQDGNNSVGKAMEAVVTNTGTPANQTLYGLYVDAYNTGGASNTIYSIVTNRGNAVFNDSGDDYDFRVESDGQSHMLFVDAGDNSVNINTNTPFGGKLNVNGAIVTDSNHRVHIALPSFLFGAGGVNDEYWVVARRYVGSLIAASGLSGTITGSRGSTGTGNVLSRQDVNILSAYNVNSIVGLNSLGNAANFVAVDIISISGVEYYALRGRTSGGECDNGLYFDGMMINNTGDTKVFTRVRSSDAGVSVVTTNVGLLNSWFTGDTYLEASRAGFSRVLINGTETVVNENSVDYDFRVESDGNTHMLFVDAGLDRVSIGRDNPNATLDVAQPATGDAIRITASSNPSPLINAFNNGASNLFIDSNSSVSAGSILFQLRNNALERFRVEGDGDTYNVNGTFGAISDASLKENIVDAGSQWQDIKNVRVRKYSLIADALSEANLIGAIAQELEQTSPGLVKTSDSGLKSIKYSVLYMKAIKALQEAMDRIEQLEAKVAAIETKGA